MRKVELRTDHRIVGNDLDGDKKDLVVITGANQGGKSTFLRSIGLAQLMMQCGMFVPANIIETTHLVPSFPGSDGFRKANRLGSPR